MLFENAIRKWVVRRAREVLERGLWFSFFSYAVVVENAEQLLGKSNYQEN